eukprot:363887-Chlamydomonas_euryale.AAC.10
MQRHTPDVPFTLIALRQSLVALEKHRRVESSAIVHRQADDHADARCAQPGRRGVALTQRWLGAVAVPPSNDRAGSLALALPTARLTPEDAQTLVC